MSWNIHAIFLSGYMDVPKVVSFERMLSINFPRLSPSNGPLMSYIVGK